MILSNGQLDKLKCCLQAELVSAKALQQTLEREFEILKYGDAEQIENITKEKLNRLSKLQQLLVEREQLLSQWTPKCIDVTESIISNLSDDNEIASSWRQLKDITKKLKDQNEINGAIITIGQRNTINAFDILSGRQPRASTTYNLDGERQREYSSSTLARA